METSAALTIHSLVFVLREKVRRDGNILEQVFIFLWTVSVKRFDCGSVCCSQTCLYAYEDQIFINLLVSCW